jgi:capsular polysaccharide biosynthesis protein/Mrp family chromosome partitioning ATPase
VQDISPARQSDTNSAAAEEAPSIVQAIFRERWIVLACVLIAALLGVGLSQLQTKSYTASSRMFLSADADYDPLNAEADPTFLPNQVEILSSTAVLQRVIDSLKLSVGPYELAEDIKVAAGVDSSVITIEAKGADAKTAKLIADGIPAAYTAMVTERVTKSTKEAVDETTLSSAKAAINAAQKVYGTGVSDIEPAEEPNGPSSPQPIRNALILGLIGFLAATGYALYAQSFSRRRVGPVEASAIFGAPVLSEVPDRGRIGSDDAIAAAYSEPGDAYRMAAVGLDYIRGTAPGVFLVTSPHDGAGSSLTALNLAAAAADHGRRVFLLNIEDTVRPSSDSDAGVLRVPLHDLAQGRIDLSHAVERRAAARAQFGIIRLQVLHPVQGHPVPDVQSILNQLPDDTDLVLLDSPPLPASSASFVLAGQVDAAVVVVDEVTTPADLEELQRRCRLAGIPVAGVLFNHIRGRSTAGNRRRRAAVGSPPPRMYDTSPRGLPILTGGSNVGDGRMHHPDAGVFPSAQEPAAPQSGYGRDAEPASYGNGSAAGYGQNGYGQAEQQYAPASGQSAGAFGTQSFPPAPAQPPADDLPWSSVTRVTPGWEQESGSDGGSDGPPSRSRR